jgi:hypothetical protein
MRYHSELLKPYFDIGTGDEGVQHVATLEMVDERLDAFSDPEHRAVQGSVLSEITDIYARPESADPSRAEAALGKSNAMYQAAAESEEIFPLAARELIFNQLRRSRATGTMASVLRPTLRQLTALARQVAAGEYLAWPGERVGFTSEILGIAVPLWMTLERPEAIGANRALVGWTSYVRQDRAPAGRIKLAKAGVMVPRRRSFDMRLSAYDEDWAEITEQRKKVQIKSRSNAEQRYEDDITVTPVWQIGNIQRPGEAVSLATSFGRRTSRLYPGRLGELKRFAGSFLERVDLGEHQEALAVA